MATEKDKYYQQAHKNATRSRHQLIMQLARQGFKREEVNGILSMIDWQQEIDWAAEELREMETKTPAPQPIPIPPPPGENANAVDGKTN